MGVLFERSIRSDFVLEKIEWKFECRGEGCGQRQRDHEVTVWQSVTVLTLRKNERCKYYSS